MPIVTATFVRPEDIEAKVTMQMSIKHWRELIAQMPDAWPGWDLKRQINEAVSAVEGVVHYKRSDIAPIKATKEQD